MARTSKPKDDPVDEPAEVTAEPAPEAGTKVGRSVTGRPNDTPIRAPEQHFTNSTFASRAAAAGKNKRVDQDDTESK